MVLQNSLHHLVDLLRRAEFVLLVKASESVEQRFSEQILATNTFQVFTDGLHEFLEVLGRLLILVPLSAGLEGRDLVHELGELCLYVHFSGVINLESNEFKWVFLEGLLILLGADKKWKRNVVQNCINLLFNHVSRNGIVEGLGEELQGDAQYSSSHKL